jgi:hypothetical protein
MLVRLYTPAVSAFAAVMALAAGAHPLYHFAEGGSLDAMVEYLTALAAQLTAGSGPSARR